VGIDLGRPAVFRAPWVSILVPVYNQGAFLGRALQSAQTQTLPEWQIVVIDDGSTEDIRSVVQPFLEDGRVSFHRFETNQGLGTALNVGQALAQGEFLAYLPADDVYYPEHLESLLRCLERNRAAVLAYSGLRYNYNRVSDALVPGYPLQLVQVLHRRTDARWLERQELVTDDLDRMFWSRLGAGGEFVGTGRVTCEWVSHPRQRHKIIREPEGGINTFRRWYRVQEPMRFHSTVGNYIDEVDQYRRYRERPDTPAAGDGLTIVLAGELAYNADRVLALEEKGHKLYGLWMHEPYWYNTVGPLPFGHVEDLPRDGWREALRRIRPDIIYGLLNWQAVPFLREVAEESEDIPFVWHFKEGPFICLEKGTWPELIDLYRLSGGAIYSSEEMRDWFFTVLPELRGKQPSLVLDGDLPKADWFEGERSGLLSDVDGEIHTVVPGRPIGLHATTVGDLANLGIHLHFYGDFTQGQWRDWIDRARTFAPHHLHLHPHVAQQRWVSEFSKYDAGWLHVVPSQNRGDLYRATWDDLNLPARMATLATAGVPMLQIDSGGARVATQTIGERLGNSIFFRQIADLGSILSDSSRLAAVRESAWRTRYEFSFDFHTDRLLEFFRQVIHESRVTRPVELDRRGG
jgi:glycosyltransferase involved in cell wall biosynthesis